jgi:hypothetical protein
MKLPGFTAERSLSESRRLRVTFDDNERKRAIRQQVVGNLGGDGTITPASVPGGPSTVPPGYGRTCKRVPYTICVGNRCWTEYGWVCTYYPLPRAQ